MSAGQFEFSCHWSFFSIYYSKWSQNEGENQIAQRVDSVLVHLLENLAAIKVLPEILAPFYNTFSSIKEYFTWGIMFWFISILSSFFFKLNDSAEC